MNDVRALPSRTTLAAGLPAAFFAVFFGAFLIYGVGFASPMALHNAAHDSRHSFAFPCH